MLDASTTKVVENKIEGEGQYGVALGHPDFPIWIENNANTIKENDLDDFTAAVSDYYLGDGVTNNKLYVEKEDTVLDESSNDTNTIYRYD